MAQLTDAGVVRSIQILRAYAALAVVYFHCTDPGEGYSLPMTGQWGVDVFFVISGFIIARIVAGSSQRFFLKRLIRIWPMYALATFAMALAVVVFDDKIRSTEVTLGGLVNSLLFVPYNMPERHGPILELGWTLIYEMFFYLVTAIVLVLVKDRSRVMAVVVVVLVGLVVTGQVAPSDVYAVRFFQSGLLLEFVFGVCLFQAWRHPRVQSWLASSHWPLGVSLVVAGTAAMVVQDLQEIWQADRALRYGLPALIVVVGALMTESSLTRSRVIDAAVDLGDASYGLYLFHPFVVFAAYRLVFSDVLPSDAALASELTAVIVCIVAALASIPLFRYVDRPLEHRLRRAFGIGSKSAILG